MENIQVEKSDLLKTLRTNRDAHHGIYLEACEGYHTQALKLLQEHLDQLKTNKLVSMAINLPLPVDHTKDYDRIIRMVEMDRSEGSIELTETDFAMYVMDDWSWKQQFLVSNTNYSATARRMSGS